MKKKIFGFLVGIVLLTLCFVNISFNVNEEAENVLLLSNLESLACTMLEGDVSTGKGTWCDCKDETIFCGTKDFPKVDVYGVKEERN